MEWNEIAKKLFLRPVLQHWKLHNLLNKDKNSRSQGNFHDAGSPFPVVVGWLLCSCHFSASAQESMQRHCPLHICPLWGPWSSSQSWRGCPPGSKLSRCSTCSPRFHLSRLNTAAAPPTAGASRVRRELGAQPSGVGVGGAGGATAEGDAGGKGLMVCNSQVVQAPIIVGGAE